jgi:hypothetical protein
MKTTIYITREIEIEVEVRYIPAVDATYMQPPEPAEVEILDACYDYNSVILTEAERDEVRVMVLENPPEPDYD